MAQSCARQGYRPVYLGITATADDSFKDDANIPLVLHTNQVFSFANELATEGSTLALQVEKFLATVRVA